MATVHFTSNLRRHVDCPTIETTAPSVHAALEAAFASNSRLRSYVLDEQGALRKHMTVLVDGKAIVDRARQSDVILPTSKVWVMQALSGG